MYKRTFYQSVVEAIKGLKFVIQTERNMRVHLAIAVVVVLLSIILSLSKIEFALILFSIALVLVAETVNTAFELLLDYVNGAKYHDTIKMLKDIAAGGVLVAALNAVVVGVIIFGPKLVMFTQMIAD